MLLYKYSVISLPKTFYYPMQRLERLSEGDSVFCFGSGSLDNISKTTDDTQQTTITSINEVTGSVQLISFKDQYDDSAWDKPMNSLEIESSNYVYSMHPASSSLSWVRTDKVQAGYKCYAQGRIEGEYNIIMETSSSLVTGSNWLEYECIDHCFNRYTKSHQPYLIRKISR